MRERYTDLDDLWSEWGDATSAIMKHIENNEQLANKSGWKFNEGYVIEHHQNGYSVVTSHSAYDPSVSSNVQLHVQAKVSEENSISVKTNKRELADEM